MKYLFVSIFFLVLITLGSMAQAQQREKRGSSKAKENPSSVDPGSQIENNIFTTDKRSNVKGKSSGKTTEDLKREYDERMEANAKKYKKMAKEMEKPQYSDASYFGHKKKPKKHRIGKKKFCKECGMVH